MELPVLMFASQAEWAAWLEANHAASAGVWLKIAKKSADQPTVLAGSAVPTVLAGSAVPTVLAGSAVPTVGYAEALDVALCYGWIDGQKGALDDTHWLQRFTPRTARSKWSRLNRDKAAALIDSGRMRPAGLREVTAAQADGRWDAAYAGQRSSEVPPDLAAALAANPEAEAFFATLSGANRYAILYRTQDAKRPETRARRIGKFVAMLAAHETIHPQ